MASPALRRRAPALLALLTALAASQGAHAQIDLGSPILDDAIILDALTSTGDFFGTIFDDLVDLELLNLLIEGVESLFASFS